MNKHKIPIGNLFGGFNNRQYYILTIIVVFLLILYKINIIIMLLITFILIIYLIYIYYKTHKLTFKEKEQLNTNISWHNLTENELLFLKIYYKAKLQIYIKNSALTFIFLLITYIVLYIDKSNLLKDISIIFIIYIIISLASIIYLLICQTIDTSAECSYIPIKEKYSMHFKIKGSTKVSNYAIIVLNHKKHIYKIKSIDCNKIMIISYKGISTVISSNVFPN